MQHQDKENLSEQQSQNIRKRHTCEQCDYKFTTKIQLEQHKQMQHQDQKNKIHRKRKNCDICNKKFNKEETYNKHICIKNIRKVKNKIINTRKVKIINKINRINKMKFKLKQILFIQNVNTNSLLIDKGFNNRNMF